MTNNFGIGTPDELRAAMELLDSAGDWRVEKEHNEHGGAPYYSVEYSSFAIRERGYGTDRHLPTAIRNAYEHSERLKAAIASVPSSS